MHGLSTIVSLIIKLFSKLFRTFGINGILIVLFVIELVICFAYIEEEADYDTVRKEYEFADAQILPIATDDPLFREIDYDPLGDAHCYLVHITVQNNYADTLGYLSLDAENEKGDYMVCRRVNYYGENMSDYAANNCLPAGSKGVLTYMLSLSDLRYEETNKVTFFEFGDKKKEKSVTVNIPKE